MTNLSPAAQALLDAWWNSSDGEYVDGVWTPNRSVQLAAALEAAADQCKLEWNYHPDYPETESVIIVSDLLAIAAELRGEQTTRQED